MASLDAAGTSASAAAAAVPAARGDGAIDVTDTESGSSYIGSDSSDAPYSPVCRWRTARFHDQECERYFDCPSHVVERLLSEHGGRDEEEEEGRHENQNEHDGSQEDVTERVAEPPSPAGGYGMAADVPGTDSSRSSSEESRVGEQDSEASSENLGEVAVPAVSEPRSAEPAQGTEQETRPARPLPVPASPPGMESIAGPSQAPSSPALSPSAAVPEVSQPVRSSNTTSRSIRGPIHPITVTMTLPALPTPATRQLQAIQQASPPLPGATGSSSSARPRPTERPLPDIVLPRWQPDAEVTYCPICSTQFSIFVRKHHCRKCGRVVCNSCSPHRITIPYQYIVQPPGQPRIQRRPSGLDESDFSGGERVRLCNPCVPDPNTTPPQAHEPSGNQFPGRGTHYRSQSNVGEPNRLSAYFPAASLNEAYARNRSVTLASGGASIQNRQGVYHPTQQRILAGTPPAYLPSGMHNRQRSLLDAGSSSASASASPSHLHNRALPPPPMLAEEDECPVCHRELPSRDLPNFESLREAHINSCITTHSAYHGGAPSSSTTPAGALSGSPASMAGTPPPLTTRRTGMFPYLATEKDCVDSAECTICLEEFEVGVPMARLECLCRFHRACISAWFVNHPGRCPVHQHDSFGY